MSIESTTKITDLDEDTLAECAKYLSLQDLSNLAISCSSLRRLSYSNSIWHRRFREEWPREKSPAFCRSEGVRDAYLQRRASLWQFKFVDPRNFYFDTTTIPKPFDQIVLDNDKVVYSQGSTIDVVNVGGSFGGPNCAMDDHKARITCMRFFPLHETSLFRSGMQRKENVLVTASCDRSIRLWWKGSSQRCFRGHTGPVSTLSDKLLGDDNAKLLASGGEDGTVRLWSLSSSGNRGQQALKATLYGHEKPIKFIRVAEHKSSLLVSIANDSKVRVWDMNTSSTARSSSCVGMTSVSGVPVDMKCHESLLYVAAGSSVVTIDLRTMQKVITSAICQPTLHSFGIIHSKSLIGTGGNGKAMLWDIRRNQETLKPEPITELDGHSGPVVQLHMDPYKIVTGGPEDSYINVWEANTGARANSLMCCPSEDADSWSGCTNMVVNGTRMVTACHSEYFSRAWFRDFSNATRPVCIQKNEPASKFWDSQVDSDSDSSDEAKDSTAAH